MARRKKVSKFWLLVAGMAVSPTLVSAGEVLLNGSLEVAAAPSGWLLKNSITGMPNASVNATEQIGGPASEVDGGLGLFLRPFAGNVGDFDGQNLPVNTDLSQTVNVSPNRTYTFTGSVRWVGDGDTTTNDGFSGGVDFMLPGSPSDPDMTGEVASPTKAYMQLEFLDASNAVTGNPIRLDLKGDGQVNNNEWAQHSLSGVSPANAVKARVSAGATDMVDNMSAQEAYFDTFKLRDSANPNTEKLQNASLDAVGAPLGFDVSEVRAGTDTLVGYRDFANHTTGGQQGFWLRSFAGGDAEIFQVLNAAPGGQYDFSTWSKWETGYAGGMGDPAVVTTIGLEFLDNANKVIGSKKTLDLVTAGQTNDSTWRQYSLSDIAPANTVKVRVSAGATGMYNSGTNPQSAFFDDFSLIETLSGLTGDYNKNGVLDTGDLDLQAAGIRGNDAKYDLNGDGKADYDDRLVWVHDLKNTWVGDADLDGNFDSNDLVTVLIAGEYEDEIAGNSTWGTGDWDADGDFTSSDLVVALTDGGYEQGVRASVAAVPEPSTWGLMLLGLGGLRRSRRTRA